MLIATLARRIDDGGEAPTPMIDKNNVLASFDINSIKVGDTLSLAQDMPMVIDKIQDNEGRIWIPLYTDEAEIDKGEAANIRVNLSIRALLEEARNLNGVSGLVINPFGDVVTLSREFVELVLDYCDGASIL